MKRILSFVLACTIAATCFNGFTSFKVFAQSEQANTSRDMVAVAMSGSNKIEAYDTVNGKHIRTITDGIVNPNGIVHDGNGSIYVSSGAPGQTGYIYKVDISTGAKEVVYTESRGRLTGIDIYNEKIYVAVADAFKINVINMQDYSKIQELTASVLITDIGINSGKLYVSQYNAPDGNYYIYDLENGNQLSKIGATLTAVGVAFDGDRLVASYHGVADALFIYNGAGFDYYINPGNGVTTDSFYIDVQDKIYASSVVSNNFKIFNKETKQLELTLTEKMASPVGFALIPEDVILVNSHSSSSVEVLRSSDGTNIGTFVSGVQYPNDIIKNQDIFYISTGVPGTEGDIIKVSETGKKLGVLRHYGGRVTGLATDGAESIFAAICDEGRIIKINKNTAEETLIINVAGTTGGTTQIDYYNGKLYASNYHTQKVDVYNAETGVLESSYDIGENVFGVEIIKETNKMIVSTSSNNMYEVLLSDGSKTLLSNALNITGYITYGSDKNLYTGSITAKQMKSFSSEDGTLKADYSNNLKGNNATGIFYTSMKLVSNEKQIGNFVSQPSNTGTNWIPTGNTIYNIQADLSNASLNVFGIDTEGGDRAKTNLLKESVSLVITLNDETKIYSKDLTATAIVTTSSVEYKFNPIDNVQITWKTYFDNQNLKMSIDVQGTARNQIKNIELLMPFDPGKMGTNIISEDWDENYGGVRAPLIINAMDMGQLVLKNDDSTNEKLNCRFTGSRLYKRTDLFVEVFNSPKNEYSKNIIFIPAYLDKPSNEITDAEWMRVRRGMLGLIQPTVYFPAGEGGFLGSPGGILGNNVISDPVSVMMQQNFEWISAIGNSAKIQGINLNNVVKYTVEYWLQQRMNENGSIDYVLQSGNISSDSNPSVLISAWDYYYSTEDIQFVKDNKQSLIMATNYLIERDVDNDGLTESVKPGIGENAFGDTGYDTISSGYKNALVNAAAYKGILGVSKMMRDIGENEIADEYYQRALRLRKAFNEQFYIPETGMYLWWIDAKGVKHDYQSPLVQEYAVIYDIADCLEQDIGVKKTSKDVMQALWNALDAAEYVDTKQGNKRVDYMDSATGKYDGFYWGIPTNLKPVPPEFNFSSFANEPFPYYCNGGIFPQDTISGLKAFDKAGLKEEANIIKTQIFKRQHEGIFENGSGFAPGVVNKYGEAYSILKWDGTPTDYEGIISRDCSFLGYTLFAIDEIASKHYAITTQAKVDNYDGSLNGNGPIVVDKEYQFENCDSVKAYWYQNYNVVDKTIKTEGSGSLKLPGTIITPLKDGIKLPDDLSNYAVTFMIKSSGVTNIVDTQLELNSKTWIDDNNEFSWDLRSYVNNTDWQKVTLKFSDSNVGNRGSASKDMLTLMRLYMIADGQVWVDDFKIVDLRDKDAPTITINGTIDVNCVLGKEVTVPSASSNDKVDGNVSVSVVVKSPSGKTVSLINGKFKPTEIGIYTITYSAVDQAGNTATQVKTIDVKKDIVKPEIVVNGELPTTGYVGKEITLPNATATDNIDGDLTVSISTVFPNNFNFSGSSFVPSEAGVYTVTYTCVDSSGNTENVIYTINAVALEDKTKPEITINGTVPSKGMVGQQVTLPNATAVDDIDGNVSVLISVKGPNDFTANGPFIPNKVGTYMVTYSAKDVSGNTETQLFNICVENPEDNEKPTITIHGVVPTQGKVGQKIILPNALATDNISENIKVLVSVTGPDGFTASGNFTPNVAGEYVITYSATDEALNTETKKIIITIAKADTVDSDTDSPETGNDIKAPWIVAMLIGCTLSLLSVYGKKKKNR